MSAPPPAVALTAGDLASLRDLLGDVRRRLRATPESMTSCAVAGGERPPFTISIDHVPRTALANMASWATGLGMLASGVEARGTAVAYHYEGFLQDGGPIETTFTVDGVRSPSRTPAPHGRAV